MKRKSLLIMLLVALFVPLAMNAQTKSLKRSASGSPQLKMRVSKEMPSNPLLSRIEPAREAALEELSTIATRAVGDYELVTSEQIDWSGHYLMAYVASNTSARVFTGKSGNNNYGGYTTATISNNIIAANNMQNYDLTIAEVTYNNTTCYTIKVTNATTNGYLGLTQNGNTLNFSTNLPTNNRHGYYWTISYDNDKLTIFNVRYTSREIQWNNNNGQYRFCCYQSTMQPISLFKLNDGSCVPPTNFAATDVDMESATLSWTENGQAQYWVVYYIGENDANTSYEIATSNPFTLTGLTPATTYYALVTPYCGGLDQDSEVIMFTTDDYPCPAPTDLYVDNLTTNSATLHWTSEAGSYNVQYRIPGSDGDAVFFDDFENGLDNWTTYTEGNAPAWRVTDPSSGLSWSGHNGSTYVAISMSWNNSAYTADNWLVTPQLDLGGTLKFYVYTNQSYPDDYEVKLSTGGNAVRDFTVTLQELASIPTTGDWVEVSIDLSRYAGQRGYIAIHHSFYDGNYILVDDFGVYQEGSEPGPWIPATPNGNSADLTGLDPETEYEWQVMADCGSDGVSLVSSSTFTTLSACAAPTGLSAEALTNSATLSWTGYADAYNIQYREVDPTAPATLILNVPTDIWNDGTGYQLVLDADHNTYGTTIPETANFTAGTFADFEYTIPENAVCNASTNTIVVNGSATITIPAGVYDYVFLNPDPTSGTYYIASSNGFSSRGDDYEFMAGTTYEFTLSLNGQNDYITLTTTANWTPVSGTVTSPYTLTGLNPGTTYEWQVKGDGCTDWSASNVFTTLNGILVTDITADDVEVVVGATANITNLEVLPTDATNPAVTYTSNDETVATVTDAGVVTGVAVGTTTITIAATDGSGVTGTCNVTVTGIDVTGITASDVTVVNGQTATISYTVAPTNASDPSVTFTSADETVATVDASGVVTGVAVGTTTITIASVSNPEVTATINVTVTSDPNAVQFTVEAPANAHPGDVITVSAVLTAPTSGSYAGFTDLLMRIFYDNTAFQFVNGSMVYGPVVSQAQQYGSQITPNTSYLADAIQLGINCYDEGIFVTAEGIVFSAQFTVLTGAEGDYTFTAQPKDEMNFDHEGQPIAYEVTPSTVTITIPQTFTKHIIGYEDTENGGDGGNYYLIASPIGDIAPTAVTNMISNKYDLFSFNQEAAIVNNVSNEWENYKVHSFGLVHGHGYLYANNNSVDLEFTGDAYTGTGDNGTEDITLIVASETSSDVVLGLNLIGNPFGTAATLNKAYYKMQNAGELSAGSGAIGAMEGVFVVAETNGETVTFTPNGSKTNEQLVINITQGRSNIDRAIVRFGNEDQLPKVQLFGNSTKVFIPQGTKDFAVVNAEAQGEMPVSFKADSNGTYTLSVNAENVEFSYLHLIDNMTGAEVDLLETPSYSFNATTSDYTSRFKLVFAQGNNSNSNEFAFISNGNIIVNGEGMLQVIDMTGRVISTSQINGVSSLNLNAAAGVYVLQLTNGESTKTQKIVVK